MQKQITDHRSQILLGFLFLLAFLERTVFDLGPNVEIVTTAMILTSFYFGKKEAFWLTFAVMAVTDRILGNSLIFLFTWSGFLIPALFVKPVLKKLITDHRSPITKKILATLPLTATGFGANIFFFLWTNLGVWLIGNMYPKTAAGLLMSYINALPFFKNQLTSSLVFIPLGYLAIEYAFKLSEKFASRSFQPQKSLV